jgi:hypothetical protein
LYGRKRFQAPGRNSGAALTVATPRSGVRSAEHAHLPTAALALFLHKGTLSDFLWPGVLRLDRVQPPRTSAMKAGACQFPRPPRIRHHRLFPAAMLPNACSIVAICVWTSTLARVCVPVVLRPSMFPPYESFCWLLRITM